MSPLFNLLQAFCKKKVFGTITWLGVQLSWREESEPVTAPGEEPVPHINPLKPQLVTWIVLVLMLS